MLISHETPVSLLPYSWGYNDYCYCLVHLLPENVAYKEFYFKSVNYGRRVLLDNSIFELGTAFDPDQFAYWVKELKPFEYVIPDVLEDTAGTCMSMDNFLSKYSDLPGRKIGVVQGKTYQDIVDCYRYIAPKVDKIAISFDYSYYLEEWNTSNKTDFTQFDLVLPKGLNNITHEIAKDNKWVKYAIGRVMLLDRLYNDDILDIEKPHHLLGASVPWEFSLYSLNDLSEYIETIDTSNPIVAGILGKKYEPEYGLSEKWSVKLVDFIDAELSTQQIYDSFWNITQFRNLCR
jgi:hypothetical protein